MAEIIQEVTLERLKDGEDASCHSKLIYGQSKKKHTRDVWHKLPKKNRSPTTCKTKLCHYLFIMSQLAHTMDYEADECLLRENLHHDPPLHVRRTLDQSYFLTLEEGDFDSASVIKKNQINQL